MTLPKPQSRAEQYLNNLATGTGELPSKPLSRMEMYLDYIAKNGGMSSGDGGGNSKSETLLAHYVHNSNKEIHFAEFNFETGIGTTREPHGITTNSEILIVPNEWTLGDRTKNALAIPIEWTIIKEKIKLVKVNDTQLKVTKSDGSSIIPVNFSDVSNTNVDITKFHFEIPLPWKLTNFPFKSKYVKILMKGYIKSAGHYRYTGWSTTNKDGVIKEQQFLNLLGIPNIPNASSTHCVFGREEWVLDFRDSLVLYRVNSIFEGRRKGYSNMVWDGGEEKINKLFNFAGENEGCFLNSISTLRDGYAYHSNGTNIYIYDLGGDV